jgi:hypothetical protein
VGQLVLHHRLSSPAMLQVGRSQPFPGAPLLCPVKKMKTEDPCVNRSFLLGPVMNLVTHINSASRDLIAGILFLKKCRDLEAKVFSLFFFCYALNWLNFENA